MYCCFCELRCIAVCPGQVELLLLLAKLHCCCCMELLSLHRLPLVHLLSLLVELLLPLQPTSHSQCSLVPLSVILRLLLAELLPGLQLLLYALLLLLARMLLLLEELTLLLLGLLMLLELQLLFA
jgi:hypothetical protein